MTVRRSGRRTAGPTPAGHRRSARRLLIALAVVAASTAAHAAPAGAKVICVNRVSGACTENQPAVGTLGDRLQAAIDVAEAAPGTDSILVGDGTYDRAHGFRYAFGDGTLVVQGTGAAKVTLRNPDATSSGTTFDGAVTSGIVVLRELTVVAPPAPSGAGVDLSVENSRVVEARVTGPSPPGGSPTGITGRGLSIEDVTVDGVYLGIFGMGSLLNVERTTVDAESDAVRSYAGTTTIRRVVARTAGSNSSAFRQGGGTATVENAVLDASSPDPGANNQAVGSVCDASASAATTLRHVTVRSATPFGAYSSCAEPGRTATLTVRDSILAPGTGLRANGANATVTISDSRWDGSGVGAIDPGAGLRTDPPQFVGGGDLRLQPSSPLIDAGTVVGSLVAEPYAGGDVLGGPRVLDGNGDGVAAPDLGAYERVYEPVPPGGGPSGDGGIPGGGGVPDGGGAGPGAGGGPSTAPIPTVLPAAVPTVRTKRIDVPGGTLSVRLPNACVKPKGSFTVRVAFVAKQRGRKRRNVVVKVTRADFYVDGKRKVRDRKAPFAARLVATGKPGTTVMIGAVAQLKVRASRAPRTRTINLSVRTCG